MNANNGQKSFEETRAFWEAASALGTDSQGLKPTARDPFLQRSVENAIEKRLCPADRLLDVGCGDGQSTLRFARRVQWALGVDYISGFVDQARNAAAATNTQNSQFEWADATDLSIVRERHGFFDAVTCIRCLINLATWENQAKAIHEIAHCLRPNGLLLISEGWDEGFEGLNILRARVGLPPMQVVGYNLLLRRRDFENELSRYFDILDYDGLGLYLYMSRVVQPLLVAPEPPRHDHPLNEVASRLQELSASGSQFYDGDYAGVYVLRRKL